MKFQEIKFTDNNAKRLYKDYINRVKSMVKGLNKENQQECLLEINSHIYEAFTIVEGNEVERLLDVFEKLGAPEFFLRELVAEKKLEEATRSFNPVKIIKALLFNFSNGVSYIIFFLLYLSLFSFVFLIFAKILDPHKVGFFYKKDHFFVLGRYSSDTVNYQPYEQLGNWFIPTMMLAAIILYVLITLLLKVTKYLKNKK